MSGSNTIDEDGTRVEDVSLLKKLFKVGHNEKTKNTRPIARFAQQIPSGMKLTNETNHWTVELKKDR